MQNNELTIFIFSMQLNMCRVGKGKRPQSDIMWPPSINHSAKDCPRWFKMICLTHTSVLVLSGKEAFKVWHTNRFYKCFLKEKKNNKKPTHTSFVAPAADRKPAVCQLLSEGGQILPREQLLREGRTVTA